MTKNLNRIFVNSLPKAGTNLVSRAFDLAGFQYGRLGIAATLVLGDHYLPRQLLRRSFFERDPIIVGLDVQMPVRRRWLDKRLNQIGDNNYITGHANLSAGLSNLLAAHGFKIVLVIRDPRDVLLSHAHYVAKSEIHFLNHTYRNLQLWDRIELTLAGGRIDGLDVAPFSVMLSNINAWMARPDVQVLRFEDIVGAAGGGTDERQEMALSELGNFVGTPFDAAQMRQMLHGKSHTFRKGQIGSAAEELSKEQLRVVDGALALYRDAWGYTDDAN